MHITHWTWGPAKAGGLLGPGHSHRGTLPESCWPTQSRQEKVLWKGKHHYCILLSWISGSEKWSAQPKRAQWGWKPNIHHFRASALVLAAASWFEALKQFDSSVEKQNTGWAPTGQAPAQPLHQKSSGAAWATNSASSTPLEQVFLFAALFLMHSASFTCPPLAECLQGSHFQDLPRTWWQLLDFSGCVLRECQLCFGLRLLMMMI